MSKTQNSHMEHDRRAIGQKAIVFDPTTKKFLLLKDNKPGHEENWGFAGGRIDQGEEADSALVREITEELGDTFRYTLVGLVDRQLVGEVGNGTAMLGFLVLYQGGDIELSTDHQEYKWLAFEEVQNGEKYKAWVKRFITTALKFWENSQYLDDLKRTQADFENYKRRQAVEAKEMTAVLAKRIVSDLVPVLDNLHAAASHVPEEAKDSPWVTGITYIEKQFEEVLGNYGVEVIDPKPGDLFDPTQHEAIEHQASEEEKTELHIEKVTQKGYRIGERVIKAAKAIVK